MNSIFFFISIFLISFGCLVSADSSDSSSGSREHKQNSYNEYHIYHGGRPNNVYRGRGGGRAYVDDYDDYDYDVNLRQPATRIHRGNSRPAYHTISCNNGERYINGECVPINGNTYYRPRAQAAPAYITPVNQQTTESTCPNGKTYIMGRCVTLTDVLHNSPGSGVKF